MKRLIPLALAVVVFAWAVPTRAEVKTVKGEVVDVACQLKDKTGPDHAACATKCAQKGAALGILTSEGIYTITGDYTAENNKKLIDFVAKNVEAKGEVTEKDGKYEIDVKSIETAKEKL